MANYCCVCGKKIGLLDSYQSIKETNEIVCMTCDGLLLMYKDMMWKVDNSDAVKKIDEDCKEFIRSNPGIQAPEKLELLWNQKREERLGYLTGSPSSTTHTYSPPDPYKLLQSQFILATTNTLEGYHITKQLGVVYGETVFKPSAGQQFASAFGDMFRSLSFSAKEMTGQVSIIEEARKFAYTKMMTQAKQLGANAIIGIDSDNTIGENICYLSLYGTAVYAELNT